MNSTKAKIPLTFVNRIFAFAILLPKGVWKQVITAK